MAISNRSPSPISSRTTNPNPRTPETNNNIRKSFNGNPLKKPLFVGNRKSFNPATPANSPAEFLQRSLSNKEGLQSLRASYECKENEKDQNLKSVRLRSPSISGSKNFMAPTISAVSKIAASPRKKILGERNESVRSSDSSLAENLSFAEKIESLELISSCSQVPTNFFSSDSVSNENLPVLEEPESNLEMVSGSEVPLEETLSASLKIPDSNEKPLLNTPGNEGFKLIKPSSSPSPALAPLDLDPSLPPYDPKTNYLSPRPLFLCYKPNPRIEVYINKEPGFNYPGEGKRLEDSFSSESCSDTENTEETQTSDSQKESEDESSEVISEEEKQTHLLEEQEETVRPKEISKLRLKTSHFLLVFIIASLCFTITDSPLYNNNPSSSLKDHTFSNVETSATMEANPIDLFYNFKLWLEKSTSYLSKMNSISRVEKMGLHYDVNLTILDQEVLLQEYPAEHYCCYEETEEHQEKEEDYIESQIEETVEEIITKEVKEEEEESLKIPGAAETELKVVESVEFQDEEVYVEEPQIEEIVEEVISEGLSVDDESSLIVEEVISEGLSVDDESSLNPPHQIVSSVELQDKDGIVSRTTTLEPVTLELTPRSSDSYCSPQSTEMDVTHQNPGLGAVVESVTHDLADKFVKQTVLQIISLVILTLITTGSVFLFVKSKKNTSSQAEIKVEKLKQPNKLVFSSLSASIIDSKTPQIERFCSQNWAKEEEMDGQSGPSEMCTSFQNSSSCRQRGSERENEVESHERSEGRNRNRESSSDYSAGSPSYGSFTTYEKIHKKHGCAEEMVTPVRRSNRIKKQIISS